MTSLSLVWKKTKMETVVMDSICSFDVLPPLKKSTYRSKFLLVLPMQQSFYFSWPYNRGAQLINLVDMGGKWMRLVRFSIYSYTFWCCRSVFTT